jgi:hypothetical protein
MDNREYTLGVEAYVEEEIPNIEEEFLKAPWLSRRFWIFLLVPVVAIGIAFYPPSTSPSASTLRWPASAPN